VTKEDIFYFVYGLLHSEEYREKYASDLKKTLPRIPFVRDFWGFSKAGRALAELHLNYESVEPYSLEEKRTGDDLKVIKMRFPKKDQKDTIIYNSSVTLSGIPNEAYEYQVNGKSAIEWIMDRYQVTIDKNSGIKNDPNEWSEDPRYILDLLKRIVSVSLETMKIVKGLPKLDTIE
jgi:predicted helicase